MTDRTFDVVLDALIEVAESHHSDAHQLADWTLAERWQQIRDLLADASAALGGLGR
jgi:hypothetical protein